MKIRRIIVLSYLVVVLIPVLILGSVFLLIRFYSRNESLKDYAANTAIMQKYEDRLQDPDWYLSEHPPFETIMDLEDQEQVQIMLYDREGRILYRSTQREEQTFRESRESLMSGLYDRKFSQQSDSIKIPLYVEDEMVGVYSITVLRSRFVNNVNTILVGGILLFFALMLLVVFWSNHYTQERINRPLQQLIFAMNQFAKGKYVSIPDSRADEIGEIVDNFSSMRNEILRKNQMLKKEEEEKAYMVMAISHDLKTPLTSIRTNAELLSQQTIGEQTKLDNIIMKCDTMNNMLDDLMNYNDLQKSGSLDLVVAEAEELFETFFYGYDHVVQAKKQQLQMDIQVKGEVSVDFVQMNRVVGNLIMNAIKHSRSGDTIYLSVYSEEAQIPPFMFEDLPTLERKGKIIFFVKNKCEKISDHELMLMRKPFYKRDSARTDKSKGAGLGLSIVDLILQKHNATMELYSGEQYLTAAVFLDRFSRS